MEISQLTRATIKDAVSSGQPQVVGTWPISICTGLCIQVVKELDV